MAASNPTRLFAPWPGHRAVLDLSLSIPAVLYGSAFVLGSRCRQVDAACSTTPADHAAAAQLNLLGPPILRVPCSVP